MDELKLATLREYRSSTVPSTCSTMRFDRNNLDYKPCPPAAMRRMQNNPLETKRPHRDKVGTKAAAAGKKVVQGAYYRHLSGKRFQVKIQRGTFRPLFFSSPSFSLARPSRPSLKTSFQRVWRRDLFIPSDWTRWQGIYFVQRWRGMKQQLLLPGTACFLAAEWKSSFAGWKLNGIGWERIVFQKAQSVCCNSCFF